MPYNTAMKNLYWSHELTITSLERNDVAWKKCLLKAQKYVCFLFRKRRKKDN